MSDLIISSRQELETVVEASQALADEMWDDVECDDEMWESINTALEEKLAPYRSWAIGYALDNAIPFRGSSHQELMEDILTHMEVRDGVDH